jgi:succinate dehydrogenase/fumarate reductase flavoprotein subunit
MIDIDKEPIEVDVLIAGGGIGGLMAAIQAAEQGVSVIVAEKANTKRSGSGATGNDHFTCYIPEVHGPDINLILKELMNSLLGNYQDISMATTYLKQSFDRVKDWDSWGINMKPHGFWEFTGHGFPGRPRIFLKYEGFNQKQVLTDQAKKGGARIENHLPLTEVITKDGEVIGAIGLSIKDEKPVVKLFRTKCVVLTTGAANRLYPPMSPGWIFNTAFCPSNTGSGRAMAYRAGAKLINMEIPNTHAGPKYLARCGKATWIGVYKDPYGKPVGPFVEKPTRELGDITADVWNSVFTDYHKSGKGPVYIDCTNTSKEDLEYMMWGLKHEGNTAMLDYMEKEGIDLKRHRIEFMRYEPFLIGSRGIEIDPNAETNIKGLYAAGDEVGNFRADIAGAATFGWIAGKSAAERAKRIKGFQKAENNVLVKDRTKFYTEILERKSGPSWKEANLALQQIMNDYAGITVRSETLLKAGLKYLRDLKRKVLTTLTVENSHTLLRSLETMDLIECGEAIFLAASERKETRGLHIRSDFPFTNPLLQDRFLTIRQEKGKVQLEWRDRK